MARARLLAGIALVLQWSRRGSLGDLQVVIGVGHPVSVIGLAPTEWATAERLHIIRSVLSLLGVDPFPEFVGRSVFDRAVSRA